MPLWLPLHYNWLRGKPRGPGLDRPGGKACPSLPTGLKKKPASEDHWPWESFSAALAKGQKWTLEVS
jgi:hypothetical protein